jgi:hypothetical protein
LVEKLTQREETTLDTFDKKCVIKKYKIEGWTGFTGLRLASNFSEQCNELSR